MKSYLVKKDAQYKVVFTKGNSAGKFAKVVYKSNPLFVLLGWLLCQSVFWVGLLLTLLAVRAGISQQYVVWQAVIFSCWVFARLVLRSFFPVLKKRFVALSRI